MHVNIAKFRNFPGRVLGAAVRFNIFSNIQLITRHVAAILVGI